MANIGLELLGRFAVGVGLPKDVLVFATADGGAILPIWVGPLEELHGRPNEAVVLARMIAASAVPSAWMAEISTLSRGQATLTLVGEGDTRFDARPRLLEALWHESGLKRIVLSEVLADQLLPVPKELVAELRSAAQRQGGGDVCDAADDDAVVRLPLADFLQPLGEAEGLSGGVDGDFADAEDSIESADVDFDDALRKFLEGEG